MAIGQTLFLDAVNHGACALRYATLPRVLLEHRGEIQNLLYHYGASLGPLAMNFPTPNVARGR